MSAVSSLGSLTWHLHVVQEVLMHLKLGTADVIRTTYSPRSTVCLSHQVLRKPEPEKHI